MDGISPARVSIAEADAMRNQKQATMREQATQLEGLLFAQLLQVAHIGEPSAVGAGPSEFDSFLRQAQADAVAGSGQTGLAEAIYRSMSRRLGAS